MKGSTLRAALAGLAMLSLACGGGGSKNDTTGNTGNAGSAQAQADDGDDPPVSADGKKWGGWRWKGNRKKCYFVHNNKCFRTQQRACRAAGCTDKRCKVTDGAPAKVSCPKK